MEELLARPVLRLLSAHRREVQSLLVSGLGGLAQGPGLATRTGGHLLFHGSNSLRFLLVERPSSPLG